MCPSSSAHRGQILGSPAAAVDLASNSLLSVLRQEDSAHVARHLAALDLKPGELLHEAGETVEHTWFPTGSALASYIVETQGGDSVEVALIGREGAIGGIVSNGSLPAYATAKVHFGGRFLRMDVDSLEAVKIESIVLRHWFARYSDCLLAQAFQSAACNATHTIVERAAKWLLAAAERIGTLELQMTQEQLAEMLGVGRSFVNRVIAGLRREGIVETRRGLIAIRDKTALEGLSCDCNDVLRAHFATVLDGAYNAARVADERRL